LLLDAYINGIFPWYSGDIPVWWNPNPRFVLYPHELKVSKSMRPYFNQKKFHTTFNCDFNTVIDCCKHIKRPGQSGTWLNSEMIKAYTLLHEDGYAHSVEVWDKDRLAGGLYGILLNNIFFGESMFSLQANASKFGFITLVKKLMSLNVHVIDCQQETRHLESLGAKNISRDAFMECIEINQKTTAFTKILE
jgi:leucyl/phenylalanyl-tRNA--protein transferase